MLRTPPPEISLGDGCCAEARTPKGAKRSLLRTPKSAAKGLPSPTTRGPRSPVSAKKGLSSPTARGPRSPVSRPVSKFVATAGRAKKQPDAPVALHVYDASWLAPADSSIPIVHLGVEVHGTEFFFGTHGVQSTEPGGYDPERHRHRLVLGSAKLSKSEVIRMLLRLKEEWPGESYRLIGCNCQTFALELCARLGLGSCIPEQYVYFAKPLALLGGIKMSLPLPLAASGHGCGDSVQPPPAESAPARRQAWV